VRKLWVDYDAQGKRFKERREVCNDSSSERIHRFPGRPRACISASACIEWGVVPTDGKNSFCEKSGWNPRIGYRSIA
jgi:hypothetical protein